MIGVEQGVAVLDAVQGAQDGVPGDFPAVAAAPLDVADPDGDPGQFGGEFVDLDPQDVVRSGLHPQLRLDAELLGLQMHLLFQIAQGLEGKVEKVPGAAGRVEDPKEVEPLHETVVGGAGLSVLLGARPLVLAGGDRGLGLLPFRCERLRDQGINELGDRTRIGVVGPERGAGRRVETPLKKGAEDGGIDGPPVHLHGGGVKGGQIGGGKGRDVDGSEEAAVEPGNVVIAVFAARLLLHGGEEPSDPLGGFFDVAVGAFENLGKNLAGQ